MPLVPPRPCLAMHSPEITAEFMHRLAIHLDGEAVTRPGCSDERLPVIRLNSLVAEFRVAPASSQARALERSACGRRVMTTSSRPPAPVRLTGQRGATAA